MSGVLFNVITQILKWPERHQAATLKTQYNEAEFACLYVTMNLLQLSDRYTN